MSHAPKERAGSSQLAAAFIAGSECPNPGRFGAVRERLIYR